MICNLSNLFLFVYQEKQLEVKVQELGHIESGTVDCGNSDASDGWLPDAWELRGNPIYKNNRYRNRWVHYAKPYIREPAIHISIGKRDIDNEHNDRLYCWAESEGGTTFLIECYMWDDTKYYNLQNNHK